MLKYRLLQAFTLICFTQGFSQTCQDASVELTAEVSSAPPRITLHWVANASATQHHVYRKLKNSSAWGSVLASLPGSATSFVDTTVSVGTSYEYRIIRAGSGFTGYGYMNSGIEVAATEHRGSLVLVIDSLLIDSLSAEIDRLILDLEGDGWSVVHFFTPPSTPVPMVRQQIIAGFQMMPSLTRAVFILGHVPVPYSGDLNPDAHPDHLGAWPADVYYGDINGAWTDVTVNNVVANDPRNKNTPGDGKFDQSLLPSDVDAQVGRVDFAKMSAFAQSEIQLLRNYLNKDHAYRHKMFVPEERILIDDNFGFFGTEAFAANGWKNSSLVGAGNTQTGDYFGDLAANSYLWSYGCGGGSYSSAGGIGTTNDFAGSNLQTVFTMLFGSYFGDWDSENNFLRAPLAQGTTLTNAWAGRPHWMFHHMGLGETIGYSTRVSQNNSNLYFFSYGARGVHMALMGDPTLRNDVVAPVSNVSISMKDSEAHLSWAASTDPVLGYYIYKKHEEENTYMRINTEPVTATTYVDPCLLKPGTYTYMVRALVLEESPSGTYYNLSQGKTGTIENFLDNQVVADVAWSSNAGFVYFENFSLNATEYFWDFGDGDTSSDPNPVHDFGDGEFTVIFVARNSCDADTISINISVSTAVRDVTGNGAMKISPNPSTGKFHLVLEHNLTNAQLNVYNTIGKLISSGPATSEMLLDISSQPDGVYVAILSDGNHRITQRVVLQR